jgi:hypothetical protein
VEREGSSRVRNLLSPWCFEAIGNRDGPDFAGLSNQVNDGPVVFTTLERVEGEFGKLSTAKPTA